MIIIGMLHHRKNPTSVKKSYAYAAVAKAEGVELLYFSPKGVDFEKKLVKGYIYHKGNWVLSEQPFPAVIYNTGSPEKLARSSEILAKLKNEIPFTTHSIGNKMRVYERLKKSGEFADYLIPTERIYSLAAFYRVLEKFRKIVFKPVNGHKGQGITFIEKASNYYNLALGSESQSYSKEELSHYVSARLREETYLIQPYINCRTKTGQAFDLRAHVQKNENGIWTITTIYPRIAPPGSIIANINSGGSTNYLEPFLKQEFGEEYFNIKRYLEHFSLQLALHLDTIQQAYFSETIDELGIDVGLDDMNKIWIFEVNWRPGCPPAFYLELDVVKNMIRYAIFLAKQKDYHVENL